MPSRAPYIAGCGCIVPPGAHCEHQRQRDNERKARHDANRPSARKRGYSREWQRARAEYLKVHRQCVRCGSPANVVDHIVPHRGDMALFWDRTNWQAMCGLCHVGWKQKIEAKP